MMTGDQRATLHAATPLEIEPGPWFADLEQARVDAVGQHLEEALALPQAVSIWTAPNG
jgi:hypothetical protein